MKENFPYLSQLLDEGSCDALRATAQEAEGLRDLHPQQLAAIYARKWFKMFLPGGFGGLGLTLPRALRLEESLSWADGSTGWVVTLCAGAGWFAGFLPPALLAEIIADNQLCIAGSGAVTGNASRTSDGYVVSGTWKYASGSLHATAFTANCFIQENGVTQLSGDGSPMVRSFLFHRDEVVLHRHWKSMGMIATGSHSFEVKALSIPIHRCFSIDPDNALLPDPVYRYPFLQLAETTLSINLSGMAMRFLELCRPLFAERMSREGEENKSADLNHVLNEAVSELNHLRSDFYAVVDSSWEVCVRAEPFSPGLLEKVSASSQTLARRSLKLVDALYPHCGLAAANTETEMNRVWRNIHTASQHVLFRFGGAA